MQLIFSIAVPVTEAEEKAVQLEIKEKEVFPEDTFDLSIKKNNESIRISSIELSDTLLIDEDFLKKHEAVKVETEKDKKEQLVINWEKDLDSVIIPMTVKEINNDKEIEFISKDKTDEETLESAPLKLALQTEEVEESKEQESKPKEDKKKEPTSNSNHDDVEKGQEDHKATNKKEESKKSSKDKDEDKVANPSTDKTSEENKNNEIKKEQEQTDKEAVNKSKKNDSNNTEIQPQAVSGVNSWESFVDAMGNEEITDIEITGSFSKGGSKKVYDVSGDKKIIGNGHTINFENHRFNIQNNQLEVHELVIKADQTNYTEASVFYSSSNEGELHLSDTSYAGTENAQVAKLKEGYIKLSGKTHFHTKGPFEVFEAKDITFAKDADFIGEATQTGAYRKETFNLYNNPHIIVEPNASVKLKTQSRNSVINVDDDSSATLDIGKNATLEVVAENMTTHVSNKGKPIINLPGSGSSIDVAEGATFDIINHRDGRSNEKHLGKLLAMQGTLTSSAEGSKVAYWNKGSDINQTEGENYVTFPRILNGKLNINGETIDEASADESSSLAESENKEKDGKSFAEVFSNKDIDDMKRMLFLPASFPAAPKLDEITDQDDKITGSADPGSIVEVKDENGNTWTMKADADKGTFTINLEDVSYKAGEKITATAKDKYGAVSEESKTIVVGTILEFDVPEKMMFETTEITDEDMTIHRADEDWSIDVRDTRGEDSKWRVTAEASTPLENEHGHQLDEEALTFMKDDKQHSLNEEVLIEEGQTKESDVSTISWKKKEGILIQMNPIQAGVSPDNKYSTSIEWTLTDAP